jgi:hypothetical protein
MLNLIEMRVRERSRYDTAALGCPQSAAAAGGRV